MSKMDGLHTEIKNLSWTIEVKDKLTLKIKDQLANFLAKQGPHEDRSTQAEDSSLKVALQA